MSLSAKNKILAGPILRRLQPQRIGLWLVTTVLVRIRITLTYQTTESNNLQIDAEQLQKSTHSLQAGEQCYFHLIDLKLPQSLPTDIRVYYDLQISAANNGLATSASGNHWQSASALLDQLCYPGEALPSFVIREHASPFLHGSCRKPHHQSGDALVRIDTDLQQNLEHCPESVETWPALLIMSGDQIYADDVAGVTLMAIRRVIKTFGLWEEVLPPGDGSDIDKPTLQQQPHLYQRENILPTTTGERKIVEAFFSGARKPIFTSANAQNHLLTLAEMLAMYLLVWSPECWEQSLLVMPGENKLDECPFNIPEDLTKRYQAEQDIMQVFVQGLPQVRRVMAHLPVAMMFDDHDVTDDWNLTAAWEQAAYGHALSRRIIGNALIAYWLCQGFGNAPESFSERLIQSANEALKTPGETSHNNLINQLLGFKHWHYQWPTNPPLVVLDTRTHRWHSEKSLNLPSGLMDWEALTDLQQTLLGHDAVIMVSPAPIFGVKFIEIIQAIFTWFGKPLIVDAENWMAHSGAAMVLLNMFRHSRTPKNFIILSGDVHYSFAYHVKLRRQHGGPEIWQLTSSGLRNEFPATLLEVFDRLNRWLYAPWSPLNWLTKRRRMRITPHKPEPSQAGERLVNASGVGYVELDKNNRPKKVLQRCSDGRNITFIAHYEAAHWD